QFALAMRLRFEADACSNRSRCFRSVDVCGIGTDHRTVWMRYRLECNNIGTRSVKHRKTIRPGTELGIEHVVEILGELISTIGWGINVGFHDRRHDLRVRTGNIIGGKMWVSAGEPESSRMLHSNILVSTTTKCQLVGAVHDRDRTTRDAHEFVVLVMQPDVPHLGASSAGDGCGVCGDDVAQYSWTNVVRVDLLTHSILFIGVQGQRSTDR